MISYRAIQNFDQSYTPNIFISMESCQTQTHIHINFLSISDDSNDEVLEILLNLYPAFGQKIFLSHLVMRIHRMPSPLTRSDRFLIDRLTTFIHIPSYPEYPIHILMPYLDMNQNMSSCIQDFMVISGLKISCTTFT